jgi:hypothetical protein
MKSFRCTLLFFMLLNLVQAQPVAHYFTQMPAPLIPGITIDTRKDLIDFCKNGKLSVMPAAFGGKVQLKELADDYLFLQTSENTDLQIKILSLSDSTRVLAVLHSAAAPFRDSRMKVYTTVWKPYIGLRLPEVTVKDFIWLDKAVELGLTDRISEIGPRLFVSFDFGAANDKLVVRSSLKEDMDLSQREVLGKVVRDSIVYRFDKDHFIPE